MALHAVDLDGDRRPDLALAVDPFTGDDGGGSPGFVSIPLQRDGILSDPVNLLTGIRPTDLAAADLDGDGFLDIAAGVYGGAVAILFNRGDARFRPPLPLDSGGVAARGVQLFDPDGDGDLDLASVTFLPAAVTVIENRTTPSRSRDENRNGVPDLCEGGRFRRGDANGDATVDLSDGIAVLSFLFLGGPAPACADAADTDDSGALDLGDALRVFDFLFLAGDVPPAPGPVRCGFDPSDDALLCAPPQGCR